jgi:hypothetical protein
MSISQTRGEIKPMKVDAHIKPVPSGEPLDLEEKIRQRAYELFEARGREEGHEFEDWLQAEAEIMGRKTDTIAA